MAILSRCENCKSEQKLGGKSCTKCGELYAKQGRKFRVVLRDEGRKVQRIVQGLQNARDIEAKLRVDIARKEHDLEKKKPAPTMKKVWEKYLPWAQENKAKSWYQDFCNYQKHLEPAFGRLPLDKISQFDIERFKSQMGKSLNKLGRPYAPATIRHQLVLLGHLYRMAGQWGLYGGPNPCQHVRKPKLNNQKNTYLSDSELSRLLETLDRWPNKIVAAIVRFALHTGLRRGEIFRLTWDDVDLDWDTMTLLDPKGGNNQTLPLSPEAVKILKGLPKKHRTPWIFYGRNGTQRKCIRESWAAIRKAAGLPHDFRLHDLRHHFASALVSAGVDLYRVQKLLTHKDPATTQRYAHLSDKALRDAVAISDEQLHPELKDKQSIKEKVVEFITN